MTQPTDIDRKEHVELARSYLDLLLFKIKEDMGRVHHDPVNVLRRARDFAGMYLADIEAKKGSGK